MVDKILVRFDWLCDPDAEGIQWDGIEDISQSSLKFLLKLFVKHFAVRRGEVDLINRGEKNAISTFANDDERIATTLLEMRIFWLIMLYEIRKCQNIN